MFKNLLDTEIKLVLNFNKFHRICKYILYLHAYYDFLLEKLNVFISKHIWQTLFNTHNISMSKYNFVIIEVGQNEVQSFFFLDAFKCKKVEISSNNNYFCISTRFLIIQQLFAFLVFPMKGDFFFRYTLLLLSST